MRANPCAGRGACAAPAAFLPAVAAPVARPVLMPLWMLVAAVIALLIAIAWFVGTLMTTRRDTSRAVADIPMAPADRREWIARVEACSTRFHDGQIDLRALHLELAEILRGFAAARTGEPAESATAQEILRMAGVRLPGSVQGPCGRQILRMAGVRLHPFEELWRRRRPRPEHDLEDNPLGHVGRLLEEWEQPSFDRDPRAAAQTALDQARKVVRQW